jgi:hypothetical protein
MMAQTLQSPGRMAREPGDYTLRRVFQIALTAELMRLGITAQRAGNLAALFIDRGGERPAVWRSNPDHPHRLPRHMFANGATVLIANKDRLRPILRVP